MNCAICGKEIIAGFEHEIDSVCLGIAKPYVLRKRRDKEHPLNGSRANEEIREKLSEHMRGLRKSKKLTILQVSKIAGVSTGSISHLESGAHTPSLDILYRMSQFYGIELSTMLKCLDRGELE